MLHMNVATKALVVNNTGNKLVWADARAHFAAILAQQQITNK